MKFRKDFVTNSSSSSFVCDITGSTESGWDMCLSEAEMVECTCGHTFYSRFLEKDVEDLEDKEIMDYLDVYFEDRSYGKDYYKEWKQELEGQEKLSEETRERIFEYMEWSSGYELPDILCPICSFKVVQTDNLIMYLNKLTSLTKAEAFKIVKEQNKRRRKLYDNEYIEQMLAMIGKTKKEIEQEILDKYDSYEEFINDF